MTVEFLHLVIAVLSLMMSIWNSIQNKTNNFKVREVHKSARSEFLLRKYKLNLTVVFSLEEKK